MDARLIIDPPARGSWNMAADEALFEVAQESGRATLRFYQWSEPTLTLGYFQPAAHRDAHTASRAAPLVRRATGGGAILHDNDLTYSLMLPIQDDHSAKSQEVVQLVHEALIEALAEFGVAAQLFCLPAPREVNGKGCKPHSEPFLCFQRRAADDVLIGAAKIAGSAQRRLHNTLLQHGSVLIGHSTAAPELAGIADLSPAKVARTELQTLWLACLSEQLGWRLVPDRLSSREHERGSELEQELFGNDRWNRKR